MLMDKVWHNSITIRLFSEHQSIPADKTHSGFTKRWRHHTVKMVLLKTDIPTTNTSFCSYWVKCFSGRFYMDTLLHGIWTHFYKDTLLQGIWAHFYIDTLLLGHTFTWTHFYIDTLLLGHTFTCTHFYM